MTLAEYAKRKPVTFTHSGAVAGFQKTITIVRGAGIDVDGDSPVVYLGSESLSWPVDIRFTASDGDTLLDFFRLESDASDGTWAVCYDQADGDYDGYIYYGKSDDTDASSGANTFPTFEKGSLDNFDTTGTGSANITDGNFVLTALGTGDQTVAITTKTETTSTTLITGARYKVQNVGSQWTGGGAVFNNYSNVSAITSTYGAQITAVDGHLHCTSAPASAEIATLNLDTFYNIETMALRASETCKIRYDWSAWTDIGSVWSNPTYKCGLIAACENHGTSSTLTAEYLYTRKYVATEPTVTWGTEESLGSTAITNRRALMGVGA